MIGNRHNFAPLSKAQLTAFYEALAPLLDKSGWKGTGMMRISGL